MTDQEIVDWIWEWIADSTKLQYTPRQLTAAARFVAVRVCQVVIDTYTPDVLRALVHLQPPAVLEARFVSWRYQRLEELINEGLPDFLVERLTATLVYCNKQ